MSDLAERIRVAIEDPNTDLWFPDLTDELTAREWDKLHDIGLTPDSYGTERVLSRNISAAPDVIASLRTRPSTNGNARINIETLPKERASQYQKAGVSFYSPSEIVNTGVLTCIEDAVVILNQVPSLMRTVATMVRSLHVIAPEDAEYDVSFSEPQIPFSIFISVPKTRIVNDALRVAEAITHEAMHLQLTIIERLIPLVRVTGEKYFSPWRGTRRPAQGVLHALYVFSVIDRFLASLLSLESFRGELREHIQRRHNEINRQIDMTRSFEDSSELTMTGARFVRGLLGSTHPTIATSLTS
jgi:HEXXH motif-containing protein